MIVVYDEQYVSSIIIFMVSFKISLEFVYYDYSLWC